ncbi:MAG: prepilin-type N-terminal cleavage/methylation domain-containing protein [bacterium]
MHTPTNRFSGGFTLIELGFVVAIIGIMAAILIPRFNTGLLNDKRVETLSNQLKSDLLLTRQLSINTKVSHHLHIDPTTNSYAIYRFSVSQANKVGHTRLLHQGLVISGDLTHTFTPKGSLLDNVNTFVQISYSGQVWQINIKGLTGYCFLSRVST